MSVCGPALFSVVVSRPGHHRVDMIFNGGGVKFFLSGSRKKIPDQEKIFLDKKNSV
jgi:hypothetical protein